MGGWMLEAFKMSLYMAFPVGIYYYYNTPENLKHWQEERKRLSSCDPLKLTELQPYLKGMSEEKSENKG